MAYALSSAIRHAVAASGQRIVITGAGGWLGLATLELLDEALGALLSERVRCFGSAQRTLTLLSGRTVDQAPLDRIRALDDRPSIVFHLAFLTKDRAEQMDEPAYRRANEELSKTVLDHLDAIGTVALFVASSGAAGVADDPGRSPAMRLYGELKRADEERFAKWAARAGKTAVIARVFNITGPHINKVRSYALSDFILNAMDGGTITVRAPMPVERGYVAIRDLLSVSLAILLRDGGEVVKFETGGEPLELAEVAQIVADNLGGTVKRAAITDSRADRYVGDDAQWRAVLARHGIEPTPLSVQVRETAAFLAGRGDEKG